MEELKKGKIRIHKKEEVGYIIIDDLIKILSDWKSQGFTQIDFNTEEEWDTINIVMESYMDRLETDEEFKERKRKVQEKQEKIQKRELEQLAELKKKYEGED